MGGTSALIKQVRWPCPMFLTRKKRLKGEGEARSATSDHYIKRAVGVGRKSDKAMKHHCSQGLQADLAVTQKAAM